MAKRNLVTLRLKDNSFGPAAGEGSPEPAHGQLIVRGPKGHAVMPCGSDCVSLKIRYDDLKATLMQYQGRQVRSLFSGERCGERLLSMSPTLNGPDAPVVFTACADRWIAPDGSSQDCIRIDTGNVMGALRLCVPGSNDTVEMQIGSRFDAGDSQLFLGYMLSRAYGIDCVGASAEGQSSLMQLLAAIMFVKAMSGADKVGLLRDYRQYSCNDLKFKGRVDFSRHVKTNLPMGASIAYVKRELTSDLPVNHLIRHAIEAVERKWPDLISRNADARRFGRMLKLHTPTWDPSSVVQSPKWKASLSPIRHPYYSQVYDPLRVLSRMLILNDGLGTFGEDEEREVSGVLFDGAWLWEQYLATVLEGEGFVHADPETGVGVRYAFKSPVESGELYPDFTSESRRMVLDAKYKRGWIQRDDRLQLMAYALNTGCEGVGLVFPPQPEGEYDGEEKELLCPGRESRCFWRNFAFLPVDGLSGQEFVWRMEESEAKLHEFVERMMSIGK